MDWNFGTFLWSMLLFFFWFAFIWVFIMVFMDLFRRKDIGGWAKAGWTILLVVLPALGALIYLIARPKSLDAEMGAFGTSGVASYSAAEEIERLGRLQEQGKITPAEFNSLKQRVMV